MINKAILIGNLGADPELRYTQNQMPVVSFPVATTKKWTQNGEKKERTEWHQVVAWAKTAENVAKYCKKGSKVYVEGEICTRSWQDKEGQKRWTVEIVAQQVNFLSTPTNVDQAHHQHQQQSMKPAENQNQPNQGHQIPPQYDDIPF